MRCLFGFPGGKHLCLYYVVFIFLQSYCQYILQYLFIVVKLVNLLLSNLKKLILNVAYILFETFDKLYLILCLREKLQRFWMPKS